MISGNTSWFEAIGLVAAALTTAAYLPQAVRIWRCGSARDISLVMYVMLATGTALWLTYGLMIGSLSLIAANGTSFFMVGTVLALKVRDMLRKHAAAKQASGMTVGELMTPVPVNSNRPEPAAALPPAAE
jgi:MtN3 and saliva related transmembrane protein